MLHNPCKPHTWRRSQAATLRVVIVAAAVCACTCWSGAQQRGPAMAPGNAAHDCGLPRAAAADGTPAAAAPADATHTFAPLALHTHACHWSAAAAMLTLAALVVVMHVRLLHLGCHSRTSAAAAAAAPLASALCTQSGSSVESIKHMRPSAAFCQPCPPMQIAVQLTEEGMGWRFGIFIIMLLLPPLWKLACSLMCLPLLSLSIAAVHARCCVSGLTDVAMHYTRPLSWCDIAALPASPELSRLVLRTAAGWVIPPLVLSLAWLAGQLAGDKPHCPSTPHSSQTGSGKGAKHASASSSEPTTACSHAAPVTEAPELAGGGSLLPTGSAAAAAPSAAPAALKLYTSPFTGTAISVKLDGPPEPLAALAEQMPALVSLALHSLARSGGAAQQAQPHPLLSCVSFSGCLHTVAHVQPALPAAEAQLAEALQLLLPADVQLLDVQVSHMTHQQLGAAGMWLEPVAVAAGDDAAAPAAVMLPARLLAQLAAAGQGLRVVVAASAQDAPLSDVTLRPGQAAWPQAGRLQLSVPPIAGPLLLVHLLRSPLPDVAGGGGQHGIDSLITTLPLLVLPAAACEEVRQLWSASMLADCQQQLAPGAHLEVAAAEAFSACFLPFALDLGMLLQHGLAAQGLQAVMELMLPYLADGSMMACIELLACAGAEPSGSGGGSGDDGSSGVVVAAPGSARPQSAPEHGPRLGLHDGNSDPHSGAGGAMPAGQARHRLDRHASTSTNTAAAAAAASAAGHAPAPDKKHRPSYRLHPSHLLGFPSRQQECAYQLWKAARLQALDVLLMAWNALWLSMIAAMEARWGWSHTHPAAMQLLYAHLIYAVMVMAPALVYFASQPTYLRWRGMLWSGSALVGGVYGASIGTRAFGTPELWYEWGHGRIQRPAMFALLMHLLQPSLTRLSLHEQALASIGQVLNTSMMFEYSLSASAAGMLFCVCLAGLSLMAAALLDWRMRRQWLASR